MRRILINEKNEFGLAGVKISKNNLGTKLLGSLFESNDYHNARNYDVVVSNNANPIESKNQRDR